MTKRGGNGIATAITQKAKWEKRGATSKFRNDNERSLTRATVPQTLSFLPPSMVALIIDAKSRPDPFAYKRAPPEIPAASVEGGREEKREGGV